MNRFFLLAFLLFLACGSVSEASQLRAVAGSSGGGGGSGSVTSVNVSGGSTGLSATGGPVTGSGTIVLNNGLPTFSSKLAGVIAGTGNARICFVGDSTTYGYYSNFSSTGDFTFKSYPTQLASLFKSAYGINAQSDSWMGGQGSAQVFVNDSRIVKGSVWTQDTDATLGGFFFKASAGTNAFSFTPRGLVNQFRVFYKQTPSGGTIQADIDGGTATTQSTAGTASLQSFVVTTGSVGAHTVNVKWNTGGTVYIGGEEGSDNTTSAASIVSMGWAGSTTADWNVTTNPYSPASGAAYTAVGCDLTVISLGINNWDNNLGTTQYSTDLQALITAAQTSGDVVLMTPDPTNPANSGPANPSQATQNTYAAVMRTLAVSKSTLLVDTFARWGSYAQSNGLSMYGDNFGHPNETGYADFAGAVASRITPVSRTRNNLGFGSPFAPFTYGGSYVQMGTITSSNTGGTRIAFGNSTTNAHTWWLADGGSGNAPGQFFFFDNTANSGSGNAPLSLDGNLNAVRAPSDGEYGFVSAATYGQSGSIDTGITRDSAGVIDIGTGAKGNKLGTLQAATVNLGTSLQIGSANAISFPSSDSAAGASIAIGNAALSGQTTSAAYKNTAVGYQSLDGTMTTAALENTAIGYKAMNANTTGNLNVAIGGEAMANGTQRAGAVAIGYQALSTNDTASTEGATAIGYQALMNASNGSFGMTAVGFQALQSIGNSSQDDTCIGDSCGKNEFNDVQSTGVGSGALFANGNGARNTAVGYRAIYNGSAGLTGADNTGLGTNTLSSISTTANGNTAVGSGAASNVTTGATNTVLGASCNPPTATTVGYIGICAAGGSAVYQGDATNFHEYYGGAAPAVTSCGTGPSIDSAATDTTGTVTVGTTATTCTITFNKAYGTFNHCSVTSQSSVSGITYSYSLTAITVAASVLGGDKIDYDCSGK